MTPAEIIRSVIADETLVLVGRRKAKLSRSTVRAVSAFLGRMAEEWDRHVSDMDLIAVRPSEREIGQRRYATNASSALRSAIARLASSMPIEDLERGYAYAEDSLSATDASDGASISPVLKARS